MIPFHNRSTSHPEWSCADRANDPPASQSSPRQVIRINGGILDVEGGGSSRLTVRRTWWRWVRPRRLATRLMQCVGAHSAMRIVQALIVFAFLFSASAPASEDAPLSREQRIQVQVGLAALGFDPGPADGLFGRKTRAAIWDWQEAKGLDTSGYLSQDEAEALVALGKEAEEAMEGRGYERIGEVSPEREDGAPPEQVRQNRSQPQILRFPTCGADKAPDGCWRELSSPEKCDIWIQPYFGSHDFYGPDRSVAWSGGCKYGMAHGQGTITLVENRSSGKMVEGKRQGRWVFQGESQWLSGNYRTEVHYLDGYRHGKEVYRLVDSDGQVVNVEGFWVNGKKHGRWHRQFPNGISEVQEWRNGELVP